MIENEKHEGNERFHVWTQHLYQSFTASSGRDIGEERADDDFRDFWSAVLQDVEVSSRADRPMEQSLLLPLD